MSPRARRNADLFLADLMGRGVPPPFEDQGEGAEPDVGPSSREPFFGDQRGEAWRVVARPGARDRGLPQLRDGDLIVRRMPAERGGRGWQCLRKEDVDVETLRGPDGRLRDDTVVLRRVSRRRSRAPGPGATDVNESEDAVPPDIDAVEWREMLELDKREINSLLAGIEALPDAKRAKYEGQIYKAWGVDPRRMSIAFKAVTAKQAGTSAKDFAFANWELCRNLYMGQRQSVFRYVEPGLKDPKKIEPGDLVTFNDGRQGVVHRGEIRRQKAKNQVPWMAYNPGGLASAKLLQASRRYPGKRIDKRLDVFPSYEAGLQGIREFIAVLARKEKDLDRTVEGYFNAHAPPQQPVDPELKNTNDAQRHATKGNDPERYRTLVLNDAGWPQTMRTKKLSDLTSRELETLARSIARVGEGYCTTIGDRLLFTTTETPDPDLCGGTKAKVTLWPDSAKELDRNTWWSIVFWEHGS